MQIITKLNEGRIHEAAKEHDLFLADFDVVYEYADGRHKFRGKLRTPATTTRYRMRNPITGRALGSHKPCWHGYKDFYDSVFTIDPNAKIISGWGFVVVYDGIDDYEEKFENTKYVEMGSSFAPFHYIDKCDHA